jgi:outer membrane biosynthesis protein TonB
MALKTKVRADQVVSREDGMVEWITDSGKMMKTPESAVQVVETAPVEEEAPADEPAPEPAPTPPKKEKAVKAAPKAVKAAPTPAAPPVSVTQKTPKAVQPSKPVKEKIVAKAKAKAKTVSGVRTIGGKEVDLSKYTKVKAAGGGVSYNNGDATAKKLEGKTLDDVYKIVAKDTKQDEKELRAKYKHLNVGMQRMALGNMHRKGPRTEKEKKKAA